MFYCPLSGLTPFLAHQSNIITYGRFSRLGPHVRQAWDLLRYDMVNEPIDMVLIGPSTTDHGNALSTAEGGKSPDVPMRVFPLHPCDFDWEKDWIESTDGTRYRGYQGTDIMVALSALNILALATNGRMTPKRIWKLAMDDRQQRGLRRWYSFAGIDYYEGFRDGRGDGTDTYPNQTPGFPSGIWNNGVTQTVSDLEDLSDCELIIQTIIWDGQHWIWISPDCFPVKNTSPYHATAPSLLEPPKSVGALSKIEQLPFYVLADIASCCTLPAFLCLFSVSRYMRSMCIRAPSDRDLIARSWINMSAPWYAVQDMKVDEGIVCRNGWAYLRRCVDDASMMNRMRIWGIAEQLERKADAMGI